MKILTTGVTNIADEPRPSTEPIIEVHHIGINLLLGVSCATRHSIPVISAFRGWYRYEAWCAVHCVHKWLDHSATN